MPLAVVSTGLGEKNSDQKGKVSLSREIFYFILKKRNLLIAQVSQMKNMDLYF